MNQTLWLQNLIFLGGATLFCCLVGWALRTAKPYELPQPLPAWYKVWFLTVQLGGIVLPLVALVWAGVAQVNSSGVTILLSYLLMLGLQILAEVATLRWLRSVVWVMVPYLFLPYRIWQLAEGLRLLEPGFPWMRNLLLLEIGLWMANYALDLSQLPRLFRWQGNETQT